jgi:hypothetical protein
MGGSQPVPVSSSAGVVNLANGICQLSRRSGIAQAEQKFADSFDRLAESQKLIRRQADRGPG